MSIQRMWQRVFLKATFSVASHHFCMSVCLPRKHIANCAKFQVIPAYTANIQHNGYYYVNYKLMCCKYGINQDKSYKTHALIEILHI